MRISTSLLIREHMYEFNSFAYFAWKLNNWKILFHRHRTGEFQFSIRLPWLFITNELERRVSKIYKLTSPFVVTAISVVSGKILRWSFILDKKWRNDERC